MAAETVQLGLIALISAPVIQAVFSPNEQQTTLHEEQEAQGRESPAPSVEPTTMTDSSPAPVVLAPPLPVSPETERTLFTQNAISNSLRDVERPTADILTPGIERPTEIIEPSKDEQPSYQDKQTSTSEMGLLSVLTGNINPPADINTRDASNNHGVLSNDLQANTAGPTNAHTFIRADTVKQGLQPTEAHHVEPLTDEEKTPQKLPIGAVAAGREGPIAGATGDGYNPLPVHHTTGDVFTGSRDDPDASERREREESERDALAEDHAPLAVHDGIEQGVPAQPAADGTYESVRGGETSTLSRPPLGDDAPSRSYIKRPESTIGRSASVRSAADRSTFTDRPASRAHDYAAVAPVALATEAPIHESASHLEREPSVKESIKPLKGENGHSAHLNDDEGKRSETPVRALMSEGQAYRSDGSVPGQPQQQQQGQYNQYAAPLAGAGVAAAAAYGLHQHQQNQQGYQNDPSFAQERAMSPGPNNFVGGAGQDPSTGMSRLSFQDPAQMHAQQLAQQQYHQHQQQQQQGYTNGPTNGIILPTPLAQGTGPSPGPPVSSLSPTSPARRTPDHTATDLARNSTLRSTGGLSRGSTLRKGGAFANGSALQGAGVGEAFGRDDIHARTTGADRGLMGAGAAGQAGMHRISKEEARDSKRLSKMIKSEGKIEAAAVKGAIKELESLQKVQRAAHGEELKAQQKHAKFTRVEHKARLRFLKEKERYERVEAQLRSIEADYEAKREHAAQQTELLAEKTQELNDLRAQKAADDRERELKLLSLKNPGHA